MLLEDHDPVWLELRDLHIADVSKLFSFVHPIGNLLLKYIECSMLTSEVFFGTYFK